MTWLLAPTREGGGGARADHPMRGLAMTFDDGSRDWIHGGVTALWHAAASASGSGSGGEITADQLRDMVEMIKQRDQVRMLMQGVKDDLPLVYDAMIGERDAYMANGIKRGAGKWKTMVGVVGMAHMDGIERNLDWKSVPCDARI